MVVDDLYWTLLFKFGWVVGGSPDDLGKLHMFETDVAGMPLLGHLPDLSQIGDCGMIEPISKNRKLVPWLAAIILFDMISIWYV